MISNCLIEIYDFFQYHIYLYYGCYIKFELFQVCCDGTGAQLPAVALIRTCVRCLLLNKAMIRLALILHLG
jgi:hypothetical protein